jgi:hypothetical protein
VRICRWLEVHQGRRKYEKKKWDAISYRSKKESLNQNLRVGVWAGDESTLKNVQDEKFLGPHFRLDSKP